MADGLTIITNHVPRLIIDAYELTAVERKDFDYYDWDKIERGEDSASFFRYRGQLYDLGEFMRVPRDAFPGWEGYSNDSFFSGVIVRYHEDHDHVIVGRFYS